MNILRVCFCFFFLAASVSAGPGQRQPDAKRVREIAVALHEKGFTPTELKTWPEVRAACHDIARDMGWQTKWAPDARVLIKLGLGNKYSNPAVAEAGPTHLDPHKGEPDDAN